MNYVECRTNNDLEKILKNGDIPITDGNGNSDKVKLPFTSDVLSRLDAQ